MGGWCSKGIPREQVGQVQQWSTVVHLVGTSRAGCIGKLDDSRPLRAADKTELSVNTQKENQRDDPVCRLVAQGKSSMERS